MQSTRPYCDVDRSIRPDLNDPMFLIQFLFYLQKSMQEGENKEISLEKSCLHL